MPSKSVKLAGGKFRLSGGALKFRVGDTVRVHFGDDLVAAKVIEDRGPIGINGRQLLRIQLTAPEQSGLVFEVPAQELQPA